MVIPNPSTRTTQQASLHGKTLALFVAFLIVVSVSIASFARVTVSEDIDSLASTKSDRRGNGEEGRNGSAEHGIPEIKYVVEKEDAVIYPCDAAVNRIVELNIRLLALDFDLTIVDIHTGGNWHKTAKDLVKHVRPEMKCLIHRAIERGIHLAVASFSSQEDVIRSVLADAIPAASNIVIRGGLNWSDPEGKKKQLAEARYDIEQKYKDSSVKRASTLLIDDDERNIHRARLDGYRSLWFDPEHVENFYALLESLP